jgi:HSP20 family protein
MIASSSMKFDAWKASEVYKGRASALQIPIHHSQTDIITSAIISSNFATSQPSFKTLQTNKANMPFFPQRALYPEAALYQVLASLDESQPKACQPRCRPEPSFTPRFDVAEIETAYELYGELPGIEQNQIEIEFTDAQTLVIKGKTERNAHATPASQPEEVKEKEVDTGSEKSYSATVEDEYDETDAPIATPATTTADTVANERATAADTQTPKPKYWISERKVGEFARSFSFAQRIDQDGVQASLKNGILTVVVPKSQKTGKVVVNVF